MDREGNPLFACEFTVDKEKFLAWRKRGFFSSKRKQYFLFPLVYAAVMVALLTYMQEYGLLAIACVAVAYFVLFRRRLIVLKQYDLLANICGAQNWIRKVSFLENGFVTVNGNTTLNTSYSELSGIKEEDNFIQLIQRNGLVIQLYSDCFVTGTWEECKAFLLQHTSCGAHYDFY